MDLYYALTLFHLLKCILHKMFFNKNEAVLLISTLTVNYKNIIQRIIKTKIFKNVYLIDDVTILSISNRHKEITEENLYYIIDQINNLVEEKIDINLNKVKSLYICADHFPLGIFLNSKFIKYYYFEDGCGQQSKASLTVEAMKENNKVLYAIVNHLNLFGRNDHVINRYIDMDAQLDGYEDDKAIDFCVSKILLKLTKKQIDDLKYIFDIKQESINVEGKVLFTPQHNVNLNVFTIEQQLQQTALIADYFSKGNNLIIKPHPNDDFCDYSLWFDNVEIIDRKFPSEFLPLIVENKFERILTAWSTSINSLKSISNDYVIFTNKIDTDYPKIHRYYAACQMIKAVGQKEKTFYLLGVNKALLENILTLNGDFDDLKISLIIVNSIDELPEQISDETAFIVDDLSEFSYKEHDMIRELILSSTYIIFINSENDYFFYNGENMQIVEKMVRWVIKKELLYKLDIYSEIDIEDEDVWSYMDNEDILKRVEEFGYSSNLKYTKMITKTNMIDDNYVLPNKHIVYRNIKMLEGILKSTEQRVISELGKNKLLVEEINELEAKLVEMENEIKQYEIKTNKITESELGEIELENEKLHFEICKAEKILENRKLRQKLADLNEIINGNKDELLFSADDEDEIELSNCNINTDYEGVV